MKFLLTISLRNLFRQKRRNFFLGLAMAFGVMILILASAFSHGISDIMFNKIIVYMTGHVGITINEGSGKMMPIFRDRERLLNVINSNVKKEELVDIDEAIGVFCRGVGNGKADNVVVVGIDMSKTLTEEQAKEIAESFNIVEGTFMDIARDDVENPAILSKQKVDTLNLKMNDTIRLRYRNVYGQNQAARATLVGIMSNDNIFMQGVMFVELKNIKKMMGYRPYECGNMQIILHEPVRDSTKIADRLHDALIPGLAFIAGMVKARTLAPVTVLPFMGDDESEKLIFSSFNIVSGKMSDVLTREGVMISDKLAQRTGARTGSKVYINYKSKFSGNTSFDCKIKGVFESNSETGEGTIYMHEALFYKKYYSDIPDLERDKENAFFPEQSAPFYNALGKEWVLLDRTATTDEARIKQAQVAKKKIKAATIDVNTMYETASDVLKLEDVLNLITFIAVLILFFIIVLGVINTLRMTIKERTREIGTIRAIGMQKKDVRTIFLLETLSLTFFASIAGTIIAFIIMGLLSLIEFNVVDNPMGMLLLNQHLHFLPTFSSVFGNIIFIMIIAGITAYFPARKAAKMSAAQALRHYE